MEAPTPRAIADGFQLLQELGAVDDARVLTPLGRDLARLPLDPRIGRIVLAARDGGCLAEALVIASALAVPDPRERPLEKQQAADQAHLRFRDDRSDFLSLVALWEFFADLGTQKLSHRRAVDACRAQYVNFLRLIEWRDVHRQLVATLEEVGWKWNAALPKAFDNARYALLHKAILAGLLGNIGVKCRGRRGLSRRPRHPLPPASGLGPRAQGGRSGCWRPSSPRHRACTRVAPRASTPSGSRRSRAIASRAITSSRTGRKSAARWWRASACRCTA